MREKSDGSVIYVAYTTECVTIERLPRFQEERPFFEIAVGPIGTAVLLWS